MKYKKIEYNENVEREIFKFKNIVDSIFGKFQVFKQNLRFKSQYYLLIKDNEGIVNLINCNTDLKNKFIRFTNNGIINKDDSIVIKLADLVNTNYNNKLQVFDVFVEDKEA